MTTITMTQARTLYAAGNAAGDGYPPEGGCDHPRMTDDTCDECGESCSTHDVVCHDTACPIHGDDVSVDDAVEALVASGGTLLLERVTSEDVAVVEDSAGKLVAIGGDAMGRRAWAVVIAAVQS